MAAGNHWAGSFSAITLGWYCHGFPSLLDLGA